jgi:hypothetical protein
LVKRNLFATGAGCLFGLLPLISDTTRSDEANVVADSISGGTRFPLDRRRKTHKVDAN